MPLRSLRPLSLLASLSIFSALLVGGCASRGGSRDGAATHPGKARTVTIVSINDVYRIEGVDGGTVGGLARVRTLRRELERKAPDLLMLHAGDFLYPSLASRLYAGAQMVDVLNLLDGREGRDPRMFITLGNHEFDPDDLDEAPLLTARMDESDFTWLGSDIVWKTDEDGEPLVQSDSLARSALVESGGVRVGLYSLTTDFEQPKYIESFRDSVTTAREQIADLRARGAEVIVALTHLQMSEDLEVLEALGDDGPDVVLGGHEHQKLAREAAGRRVLKADAEARSAVVVRIVVPPDGGRPRVDYEFRELDASVAEDRKVRKRVEQWEVRLDRDYCEQKLELPSGCLEDRLGSTRVKLFGEELEIRRYETNLGDWIVDQARLALVDSGAQVAFVNSGSLRLNQDVPIGPVARRVVEEIFQYPSGLKLMRLSGATLQKVVDNAISQWTGNGHFLQISGFAYRHDVGAGVATDLTLLTADGARPIRPEETLLAVVPDFIARGGDGYAMLVEEAEIVEAPERELKGLTIEGLAAAGSVGIAPEIEGRICSSDHDGPCLAGGGDA